MTNLRRKARSGGAALVATCLVGASLILTGPMAQANTDEAALSESSFSDMVRQSPEIQTEDVASDTSDPEQADGQETQAGAASEAETVKDSSAESEAPRADVAKKTDSEAVTLAASTGPDFVVDNLNAGSGAEDASIGDGVCATAEGDCTFLAALQEANAADADSSAITISFAESLGEGTIDLAGGQPRAQRMYTDALPQADGLGSFGDAGAFYQVNSPVSVEIDFADRINIDSDDYDATALLISSNNVTVKNVPNIVVGSTAIVIAGENVTVDNLSLSDPTIKLEHGVGLANGANNVTLTNLDFDSVWHSGVAVGRGQTVSNVTIDGYTSDTVGGDNTSGLFFAAQLDASTPTVATNFTIRNAALNGANQFANIHLNGVGSTVDGLVVDNVTFANSNNGGYGILAQNQSSLKNLTVQNSKFLTQGQHNIWVDGAAVLEDAQITGNTAEDTLYFFGADNYAGTLKNVEIRDNQVLEQTGGDSAIYLRANMDNVTIAENEFHEITANVVIRVHGVNDPELVKNITIEDNLFQNLEGTLIEAIYLQHNVGNGIIRGNQFIQTEEWLTANPAYDHNWAIRTAAASGWTITGNHIDGYGTRGGSEAPIRVETAGVTTVVGNTFGPRTNGTTEDAESEAGPRWFLWNIGASNGSNIQTLRPTNASADGTTARFTATQVDPQAGTSAPVGGPYTVHVYWTAAEHAEVYLGSVEDVTPGSTVEIPATVEGGFLRLQTVDSAGNVSQYSGLTSITDEQPVGPEAPVVTEVEETGAEGTGEPEATVVVRDENGDVTETAVDENGNWSVTGLECGTSYTAVLVADGVESEPTEFTTADCPTSSNGTSNGNNQASNNGNSQASSTGSSQASSTGSSQASSTGSGQGKGQGGLAVTGGQDAAGFVVGALVLLAAGMGAVAAARRRARV